MEKSTTSPAVGLSVLVEEAVDEVRASFERLCLTAGLAALSGMMEEDAARLCGPRMVAATTGPVIAGAKPRARSAFTVARSKSSVLACAPETARK